MASTYLSRTPSSNGSETQSTLSMWLKRSGLANQAFLYYSDSDSNNKMIIRFNDDDTFDVRGKIGGSFPLDIKTNRKFRDVGAFYHFVFKFDTTQATESNRFKMYVNGVQETSFSTETYPSQNTNLSMNQTNDQVWVGTEAGSSYFDGLMSHVHWTDGYAYDASAFGETDATTGIWIAKLNPSVTYGTNGFFLKFNEGALGTDSSPNGNNLTVNGSLTPTKDTPDNVFATFNPLKDGRINAGTQYKATFSNGNTTSTFSETTYNTAAFSTLAVSKGKWYTEIKCSNTGGNTKLGLFSADDYGNNDFSGTYLYDSSGTFGGSAYGNSFTTGDIIQIAFDATNGTLWFGKNGTWQNSATQSEIENGTTTNAAATGIDMTQFWNFGTYGVNGTAFQANFGNGYFGTTAVSSAGSNGNGAIFEYDVPTGYYALNTKNINTYG
jgi:hypothetical protein